MPLWYTPHGVTPAPVGGFATFRRDESGTWWVQADRVPQPKHSQVWQLRPYFETQVQVAPAPTAKPACCAQSGAVGAAIGECKAGTIGLKVGQRDTPAVCCEKSSPFAGTWARELDGMVIAATLSPCGEELKLCMSQNCEGHTLCLTVTADCKIMKEGLVHGVITGADLDVKRDDKAVGGSPLGDEAGATSLMLQQMVDCPFSFRVKHTAAGLMVSNLKLPSVGGVAGPELAMIGGMFKPARTARSGPKLTKVRVTESTSLPSGLYLNTTRNTPTRRSAAAELAARKTPAHARVGALGANRAPRSSGSCRAESGCRGRGGSSSPSWVAVPHAVGCGRARAADVWDSAADGVPAGSVPRS